MTITKEELKNKSVYRLRAGYDVFNPKDEVVLQREINRKLELQDKPCNESEHNLVLEGDCVHCSKCWNEWGHLKLVITKEVK